MFLKVYINNRHISDGQFASWDFLGKYAKH